MLNRLIALLILFLLLPLFLIIIIAIFIEDGFPILFTPNRVGYRSITFKIYKFRSMKINTPNIATHLLVNPEEYITKVGKFLRKSSLDELPNFINIIKGEMVFVGPRPAFDNQKDLIELRKKFGVDMIIPGLTGWAQING